MARGSGVPSGGHTESDLADANLGLGTTVAPVGRVPGTGPAPRGRERRRAARFETVGDLPGQTHLDEPLALLDISLGGFSAEVPIPLTPGVKYPVRFMFDDHVVVLSATVIYCSGRKDGDTSPYYVCGFAFVEQSARDREAIVRAVNTQTKVAGKVDALISACAEAPKEKP